MTTDITFIDNIHIKNKKLITYPHSISLFYVSENVV